MSGPATDAPGDYRARLGAWLDSLAERDPTPHDELKARLEATARSSPLEMLREGAPPRPAWLVFETIVREGRPALVIRDDQSRARIRGSTRPRAPSWIGC